MTLVAANSIKTVIDLSRPDGNAGVLLSTAKALCLQEKLDSSAVIGDMAKGDYVHLVRVFDKHFGHLFELSVPPVLQAELMNEHP